MQTAATPEIMPRRKATIGTVPGYHRTTGNPAPWRVELECEMSAERLSITGSYSTWRDFQAGDTSGGQCQDTIREALNAGTLEPAPGWTVDTIRRVLHLWDRWHLNDMRAGCEHQRAGIATGDDDPHAGTPWNERRIDPDKPTNAYGVHFDGQHSASCNMLGWARPDEHPRGLLTRKCPECGYGYGTAWVTEEIPADVRAEIVGLFS